MYFRYVASRWQIRVHTEIGLTSEGYNVEAFEDPVEAFAHFVNVNPSHHNLAILDIRMPGLNGIQNHDAESHVLFRNIRIKDPSVVH